jgi:hypothetical protein
METTFGTFFSGSFIISPVNRPKVDFLCADSFRLSWNKHLYATGYKIFTLTDSAYLKNILTVTDTFIIVKRPGPLLYAVQPVLNNGLPAARSIALNIALQGVQCFYRALNYELQNGNTAQLTLELSTADYTDSLFFENVTATGQLLKTYGGTKTLKNTLLYYQQLTTLDKGITYIRGKIKLNNGSVVYTNIIGILSSGKKNILFYPNPVQRGANLQYILQQGIAPGSKLQLLDITGRVLKTYNSLPNRIITLQLPKGVLIYKLFTEGDKVLETGKVVIQ